MTLDLASAAFLEGYRIGKVNVADAPTTLRALLGLHRFERPFAFEGAAMGWRMNAEVGAADDPLEGLYRAASNEWHLFLDLGVGCALARLGQTPPSKPWVLDGYGFQLGLSHGAVPGSSSGGDDDTERGRGRSIWFVTGGSAEACAGMIGGEARAAQLWTGVGTACAFAGDPRGEAGRLSVVAGDFAPEVRDGAGNASALWRALGGDPPERTRTVLEALG